MRKGKTRFYLILALVVAAASVFLPCAINLASDGLVRRILKQSQEETESETETESDSEFFKETETETKKETVKMKSPDFKETAKASSSGETGDAGHSRERSESEIISQDREESKEQFNQGMRQYVKGFKPENIFYINMEKEEKAFLEDLEDKFLKALAEYIYSLYGDQICITKIVILGTIENNAEEYAFYFLTETEDEESEGFYCLYDKQMDYFKLYSMFMG